MSYHCNKSIQIEANIDILTWKLVIPECYMQITIITLCKMELINVKRMSNRSKENAWVYSKSGVCVDTSIRTNGLPIHMIVSDFYFYVSLQVCVYSSLEKPFRGIIQLRN